MDKGRYGLFFIRTYGRRQIISKGLTKIIEENGIVYHLAEDGCYYPELRLPEGKHYNIGKYGLMRWEYLKENCRREYLRLLMDGKLNEYLRSESEAPCENGTAYRTDESRGDCAEGNDICVIM